MANSINFGRIYCSSWWGNETNKLSVPEFPEFCSLIPAICGTEYTYTGGESFPERYELDFSGATGTSTLTFDAYNVPDKWIVKQGDTVLLDTGYRGAANQQAVLNNELALRGLPPETIAGVGAGSLTFDVNNTDPVYIYVYAPLTGTSFEFTVSCPV